MEMTASGRFWLCPVCHRHVPSRNDKCQCGFDRTTVNVRMPEVAAKAEADPAARSGGTGSSSGLWIVAGIAVAVGAGIWVWSASQENARQNAELRERLAQRQADREKARQDPQVIFVPQVAPQQPIPEATADATLSPAVEVIPPPAQALTRLDGATVLVDAVSPPSQPSDNSREFRAQQEMFWREKEITANARLASAASAYIGAVCKEKLGGIPLADSKTYNQYRNDYVQAIAEAEALLEGARQAGAGWISIRNDFPPPLAPDVIPSAASPGQLSPYNCGSH